MEINNNFKSVLLVLLLLLSQVVRSSGSNLNFISDSIVNIINNQIKINNINDNLGLSYKNKYSFYFTVDVKNNTIMNCPLPYSLLIDGNSNQLTWWSDLETRVCDFNQKSTNFLKLYNLVVYYPFNSNKSDLIGSLSNTSNSVPLYPFFSGRKNGQNLVDYVNKIALLNEKIKTKIDLQNFNSSGDKILNYYYLSNHVIRAPADNPVGFVQIPKVQFNLKSYHPITSTFDDQDFKDLVDWVEKYAVKEQVSGLELYENYYNWVTGVMQYYNGLVTITGNCNDIPEISDDSPNCNSNQNFKNSAQNLINYGCNLFPNATANQKQFIYFLKEYFHRYPIGCQFTYSNPPTSNTEWKNNILQEFKNSNSTSWRNFILNRITSKSVQNVNKEDLQFYLFSSNTNEIIALNGSDRGHLFNAVAHHYDNPVFPVDNKIIQVATELLITAKLMHKSSIQTFIDKVGSNKPAIEFLFESVLDAAYVWNKKEKQEETIRAINELVYKLHNVEEIKDGFATSKPNRCFTWKVPSWAQELPQHYEYTNPHITTSGKVGFTLRYIKDIKYDYQIPANKLDDGIIIKKLINDEVTQIDYLNPFELVCVGSGEDYGYNSDCGALGQSTCKFDVMFMPTITFGWYIEKKLEYNNFKTAMTTIAVVGTVIGATEFVAAVSAGTWALAALYGTVVIADIATIVAPEMVGSWYQNSGTSVDTIQQMMQRVQSIADVVSITVNGPLIVQALVKMVRAFGTYRQMSILNGLLNTEEVEKAVGEITNILNKRPDDINKIMNKFGFNSTIKSFIQSLPSTKRKIYAMGYISTKDYLKSIDDLNRLKFIEKALVDPIIADKLMLLGDIKYGKLLSDMKKMGNVADDFISDPNLISLWDELLEAGHRVSGQNIIVLKNYSQINAARRANLILYTETTLKNFLTNLNPSKIDWINAAANENRFKCFLSHKPSIDASMDAHLFDEAAEEIEEITDAVIGPWARQWRDHSKTVNAFNSKMKRAAKFENETISPLVGSHTNPPCRWANPNSYQHAENIYLKKVAYKKTTGSQVADQVNFNIAPDDFLFKDEGNYFRAILHDTKWSSNAPWTDNQTIIKEFFENTQDLDYVVFEIRSTVPGLPTNAQVRVYKDDFYKTIGDGDGKFNSTIQIGESGF